MHPKSLYKISKSSYDKIRIFILKKKYIEIKINPIRIVHILFKFILSYKPINIPDAKPKVWAIRSELLHKSLISTISKIKKLK